MARPLYVSLGTYALILLSFAAFATPVPDWAAPYTDASGQIQRQLPKSALSEINLKSLDLSSDPVIRYALQNLRQRAQNEGEVSVIVRLRVPFAPEGFLNANVVREQRTEILQQQQSLFATIHSQAQIKSSATFETIPFMALTVDAKGLDWLAQHPDVIEIEAVRWHQPLLRESSPLIGAPRAWNANPAYTGAGQTIAILDTGVNKNHPFLSGKVVSEACYSSNASGVSSLCPEGATSSTALNSGLHCSVSISNGCNHGTHVAGIAAGRSSDFSGVAPDANLIAIQVFSHLINHNDLGASTADINSGLERVYALRSQFSIASANLSLGGGRSSSTCDSTSTSTKAIIDNLRSAGIATVIASGNEGFTRELSYPACISTAISVGATSDTTDLVVFFSNSASFLSLLAPGEWIYSATIEGFANYRGTSMAAPQVAGAWALLKQQTPNLSVNRGLELLTSTGIPIRDTRNNITKSRIQVDAALGIGGSSRGWVITTQSQPSQGGTVICYPNPVDDGSSSECNANPATGFTFGSWSGDCSGTNASCTLNNVTGAKTVTATFNPPPSTCQLTPIDNETVNGSWSSSCESINRPSSYAQFYTFTLSRSSQVTIDLRSTEDAFLYLLSGHGRNGTVIMYDDDGGAGYDARIVRTLNAGNYTLEATTYWSRKVGAFTLSVRGIEQESSNHPVTTTANPSNGGTVSCNPNPMSHAGASLCTATPSTGFTFSYWSGDCSGTSTSCALNNVTNARNVTANFNSVATRPVMIGISTRGFAGTGNESLIGGLIMEGTGQKRILFSAKGPSLVSQGISQPMMDPKISVPQLSGVNVNDDWQTDQNANELRVLGRAPNHPLEAAMLRTLGAGAYTPIVTGFNGMTGVVLMEIYDLSPEVTTLRFKGLSTRGPVRSGEQQLIGGVILQGSGTNTMLFMAKGPSMSEHGVSGLLTNPQLALPQIGNLHNAYWRDGTNAQRIIQLGRSLADDREAAILIDMSAGAVTPIISGVGGLTGIGIMEIYELP